MQTVESVDTKTLILEKLKTEERSLKWLSRKTGINYNTLYGIMAYPHLTFSKDKIDKINEVLGTNFTL